MVGIFVDVSNLYYCIGKKFEGRRLDYRRYLERAIGSAKLFQANAYGAQLGDEATNFLMCLRRFGYTIRYKKPKQFIGEEGQEIRKADWDVGLAMDVVRMIDKLNTIVIGSADGDLAPLVEWVKEKNKRCVILACGISRDLKDTANEWTEIDETLLE